MPTKGSRFTSKQLMDMEHSRFREVVAGIQDPALLVLRAHLLMEYYLERLIHLSLKRGDRLIDRGRLSFYQKLVLVDSFSILDDRIIQCLQKLNRVRNRCAHEIAKKITLSDVEALGIPLGKDYIKFKDESGQELPCLLMKVLPYVFGYVAARVNVLEAEALAEPEHEGSGRAAASPLPQPSKGPSET